MDPESKIERFERLILPHLDMAHDLARWLTRNDIDAQDVLQTACLRAFQYFDKFDGENPAAWLLAIVRNTCITWMKRNRSREELTDTDLVSDRAGSETEPLLGGGSRELAKDPETHLLEGRDRSRINELVAKLPPEFREVIVLREIEDLSYREIADVVGIPIGTVMSRLSRARKLLQDAWPSRRDQDERG